jgi:carbon monoxide dehydrogenase subunit G
MKITGENIIAADQQTVWEGLNDPVILRQSIPGCDSLELVGDNKFKATVTTRIGPITAKFNGAVELSDLNPPNGYTLSGSGSAGAMGNAKGLARVALTPNGAGTKLTYDVDAQVNGKIAQMGSRLIKSTAGLLAGQFFRRFGEIVSGSADGARPTATRAYSLGLPLTVVIAIGALAVAGVLIYLLL